MGKTSGLGDNFYVAQYNLSGGISALSSIHGGNSPIRVTGIDKSAEERIGGKLDGGISFVTHFNTAAGKTHPVLSALPTTDSIMSYFRGQAQGNDAASLVCKQLNYDPTRSDDGAMTFAVEGQGSASYPLEWGVQATPGVRTDASATAAAAVTSNNMGAAGTNGLQAYLHVFSLTSGTATIKLQTSSDDGGSDAYSDLSGGGFTAVTGATSQRIAVTGNIEQYIKVVTTGTFSTLVFAVNLVFNTAAVSY